MHRRIRWRIALPYIGLLLLTLLVVTVGTIQYIRERETELRETQYLNLAQRIATEALVFYGTVGESASLAQIAEHNAEILGIAVTFLDSQGRLLASSLPLDEQPEAPSQLSVVHQARAEGQGTDISANQMLAAASIQEPDGQPVGIVLLQVPLIDVQINLQPIRSLAVVVFLIASLAVLVLALIVWDRTLKPIETLTIATEQMGSGNFKNLNFPENPQELSELSQALQEMAQHLGEQIEALSSERATLSAVLNQMTDGVIIANDEGRVELLNPAAERLFQMDEKSGLGRSVVEVLRYHQLVDLWRTAKSGQRESTMLEIGPRHMFLQVIGIPLKTSLPGSTMILFQDLTQLRRLETVRRDFISNVSHELRTPLASLKALAETLQEGALEDPPAARRFILRMETEIDNLTQLVNELLELSRIESGKVPVSFHRIQPCDLLRPAYERMTLQVERAGLELHLDCQQELPAVFADPDRITQVLINLVHNAIKFTPPGGKITLSAYRDGEQIVFYVKDTGVGIARKDLNRIFERFYKADQARTGGGTGLGLSIARHMIESHGGYIWVESDEEIGSTFYFTLPIA